VDNFIQYATNIFPDFIKKIKGANDQEITKIEEIVKKAIGIPIPDYYKEFLKRLGHSNDQLELIPEGGTTDISDIIDYHEEIIQGIEVKTDDCITFGIGGISSREIALVCSPKHGEPKVVEIDYNTIDQTLSESLEKFLFQNFFPSECTKIYQKSRLYTIESEYSLEDVAQKIQNDFSVERQWFSDDLNFCGKNSNFGIYIDKVEMQIHVMFFYDKWSFSKILEPCFKDLGTIINYD